MLAKIWYLMQSATLGTVEVRSSDVQSAISAQSTVERRKQAERRQGRKQRATATAKVPRAF